MDQYCLSMTSCPLCFDHVNSFPQSMKFKLFYLFSPLPPTKPHSKTLNTSVDCSISSHSDVPSKAFFWMNDSVCSNQQQWGSVWPRLYSELFSRPAFYPSPSFLQILLPCDLQPTLRKCQITARTERKILITQDFPELTTGSFEYIV